MDQILYRYVPMKGLWEYKVIGSKKLSEEKTQYIVECQHCNHGYKCEVLIIQDFPCNSFIYVTMLNDHEDEEYYWHTTTRMSDQYFVSKKKCLRAVNDRIVSSLKEKVTKQKDVLKRLQKDLLEQETRLAEINKL